MQEFGSKFGKPAFRGSRRGGDGLVFANLGPMFAACLVCYEWRYATAQFGKNHQGDRNEFLPTTLPRVKPESYSAPAYPAGLHVHVLSLSICKISVAYRPSPCLIKEARSNDLLGEF
jgi:hypothetical protein